MRTISRSIVVVSLFLFLAFSTASATADTTATVVPIGLAPLYDNPLSGGLPMSYCEPSDTCHIDSSARDSAGTVWLKIKSGSKSGWIQKSSVKAPRSQDEGPKSAGVSLKADPDAKRRYRVLEQHGDWPRRIIKMVREGKICLDMNDDQLAASWGAPVQKTRAFILGAGTHELWIYRSVGGESTIVFLVKNRVVGWSGN
jgi:hypothetical protein